MLGDTSMTTFACCPWYYTPIRLKSYLELGHVGGCLVPAREHPTDALLRTCPSEDIGNDLGTMWSGFVILQFNNSIKYRYDWNNKRTQNVIKIPLVTQMQSQ